MSDKPEQPFVRRIVCVAMPAKFSPTARAPLGHASFQNQIPHLVRTGSDLCTDSAQSNRTHRLRTAT